MARFLEATPAAVAAVRSAAEWKRNLSAGRKTYPALPREGEDSGTGPFSVWFSSETTVRVGNSRFHNNTGQNFNPVFFGSEEMENVQTVSRFGDIALPEAWVNAFHAGTDYETYLCLIIRYWESAFRYSTGFADRPGELNPATETQPYGDPQMTVIPLALIGVVRIDQIQYGPVRISDRWIRWT